MLQNAIGLDAGLGFVDVWGAWHIMTRLSTLWLINAVCMTRVIPNIIQTLNYNNRSIDQYDPNSSTPESLPTGTYLLSTQIYRLLPDYSILLPHYSRQDYLQIIYFKISSTATAMGLINGQSGIVTLLVDSYSSYFPVLWIPFVVVILFLRYFVRRYFSPLRDIPGPFLASISRVWKGAYPQA